MSKASEFHQHFKQAYSARFESSFSLQFHSSRHIEANECELLIYWVMDELDFQKMQFLVEFGKSCNAQFVLGQDTSGVIFIKVPLLGYRPAKEAVQDPNQITLDQMIADITNNESPINS